MLMISDGSKLLNGGRGAYSSPKKVGVTNPTSPKRLFSVIFPFFEELIHEHYIFKHYIFSPKGGGGGGGAYYTYILIFLQDHAQL